MAKQFSVIGPSYCAPYYVNLQINTQKGATYDANGYRVFYIKDTLFTLHNRRVLCDDKGNPIVTLYKKNMTLHGRWKVFRGESNDSSQLVFSVKRSLIIPSGMIELDVFLADNKNESVRDFRVNVDKGKSSCTVYAGESPTVVAWMTNNGGFNVVVHPYVDYAFIVALLMIINQVKEYYYDQEMNSAVGMAFVLFTN